MNVDYRQLLALVDDEEILLLYFRKVLQENGYHIMRFTHPLFILDYVIEHTDEFALIIMD